MHPGRRLLLPPLLAAVLATLITACGFQFDECGRGDARPGSHLTCPVPGHTDRAFDLHVPAGWDGVTPLPVIYAFHGGGGNRAAAARVTCPDGDRSNPACLVPMATAAGFAVVLPDGTGSRPLRNLRTWNAGGGRGGWNCTSGGACHSGVDEMKYLDDLHAAVGRVIPVEPTRVHATGISNGGALSHRWACERPDVLASIAPVGGANQFEAAGGTCLATGPAVAVLHVHGTADPCWRYVASTDSCIAGENVGVKAGVDETMEAWRLRNGCDPDFLEAGIADTDRGDGATARLRLWPRCEADVQLLRIDGGGHTWPDGYAYLGEDRIGPVWRDLSGNAMILEFFQGHPKLEGRAR